MNSENRLVKYSKDQELEYKAVVVLICEKVCALATRNYSEDELDEMVDVWLDAFKQVIPLDMIQATWERTRATHRSSFMINAFDMLKNYHELAADLEKKRKEDAKRERDENPIKYCVMKKHHLDEDGEDFGNVMELIGGQGGEDVILPCSFCRMEAHRTRYQELKAKYVEKHKSQPLSVQESALAMLAQAPAHVSENLHKLSPREIISALLDISGKAVLASKDDITRGNFQKIYEFVAKTGEYIPDAEKSK